MIRAFIAIEISPELRAALSVIQQDLRRRLERTVDRRTRISWVQPASMHLTLRFLGETPEAVIESLHATVGQVVARHRTIQVPFSRLGTFPRLQQPRVLWAGPPESWEQGLEGERLQALYRDIEEVCRAVNLAAEVRPFSPHLTLARIKEGERQVGQLLAESRALDQSLANSGLAIKTVIMMQSQLRQAGSVYTKLWECPLSSMS